MLTDQEIEDAAKKAGGRWDGNQWVFEDADLHPFARALLAAERGEEACDPAPIRGGALTVSEKVVFLACRSDSVRTSSSETLACGNCGNKAWTVLFEAKGEGFPRLSCTCCGWDGGRFGWLDTREG